MLKRFMPLFVVIMLLSLALAACAPAATPAPAAEEATSEEAASEEAGEVVEQVLIGGFDVGPGGDPQGKLYNNGAGNYWLSKIFTPLVMMSADYTEHTSDGALALSWESNEDATVWTFNLRDNVVWHDGTPFTANDLKWTAEFVHASNATVTRPFLTDADNGVAGYAEYAAGEADEISGITVIDDTTLQIETKAPNPRLFDEFRNFYALPQHAIDFTPEEIGTTNWWLESPVGTGPFKFSRYEKDQFQELVAFEDYFEGRPKLDKLINRYFADETAALLALSSGDIDFSYASGDVALGLGEQEGLNLWSGPSFVANVFNYNYNNEAWNDIRVRQAIMYGIDRQSIIDDVFNGTAVATPCLDSFPAFWPEDADYYEYDPVKAKELLDAAAADGIELSAEMPIPSYYTSQLAKDILTVFQANLADIGISAPPNFVDVPTWRIIVNDNADFDLTYRGAGGAPASYIPSNKGWFFGGESWSLNDPAYQEYFDAMDAAFEWEDYVEARTALCKFQNEQADYGYLWVSTRYGVSSDDIAEFYYFPAPGGGPVYDNAVNWEMAK